MRNLVASAFAVLAVPVLAADPYAGYIYPSCIQAGTTNRFIVGGQALMRVQDIVFSDGSLRVLGIEAVPNFPRPISSQFRHLSRWLDGIAAGDPTEPPLPEGADLASWRSNRWWQVMGTLDALKRSIVERDLFVPRNALQATPSLGQRLIVTLAAAADAKPGVRSYVLSGPNGLSAPRPIVVSRRPQAAEPLYAPPKRAPSVPRFDVRKGALTLNGQVMPGETDRFRLSLAAGRTYGFTVTARELQPYVGDAVPGFFNPCLRLCDAAGRTVAFADDAARFRPDPVMRFTPKKDGEYTLEIHDVLYRGRADFVYVIAVDDFRWPKVRKGDGCVSKPGEVSVRPLKIETPGPRILEVFARRRGSPLDAVLTLRRPSDGAVLAQWDDVTNRVFVGTVPQGECDPIGRYDFRVAGDYRLEIADRTGHGGRDYVWWLEVREPTPGFSVYSTRSTLPLTRKPLPVTFTAVRRDGYAGPITLEFPSEIRVLSGGVITGGTDRVTARLAYAGKKPARVHPARIFASATIGGEVVRRPVTPCDEYEQAFAWHHLVPSPFFWLRGLQPLPALQPPVKIPRQRP